MSKPYVQGKLDTALYLTDGNIVDAAGNIIISADGCPTIQDKLNEALSIDEDRNIVDSDGNIVKPAVDASNILATATVST